MNDKLHLLEIYDAEDYEGPNPLRICGVSVVKGPERSQYYIVRPCESVRIAGNEVTQFAIRPHYDGDAITNAVESMCTVGIALTNPETDYNSNDTYGFLDFQFWSVGKICPEPPKP